MFRLIKLIIFCGFCFSVYTLWQQKEELLSKALTYVLSHPVDVKGVKIDWDGVHIQTLLINPLHSRDYNLSLRARGCTIQLSAWDFLSRPIGVKKVAIQDLHMTHYPTGLSVETLFPKLMIRELSIKQCHIQKRNSQGRTLSSEELSHCTLYNLDRESLLDLSPPHQVAKAPDLRPQTTRPKRPLQQRSMRLSSGCHIIY